MKKYIGVKIITAEPMKLGEYNKSKGVCVDKDDAHYDDVGYKVVYSDDYVSWSPKDTDEDMTHPYIYIDTTRLISENPDAPRDRVPWLASQTDMLADDWVIV